MKKPTPLPYVILAFALMIIISLSTDSINKLRYYAISTLNQINKSLKNPDKKLHKISIDTQKLQLENTMLKNQMQGFYEWLIFENRIEDQMEKYKFLKDISSSDPLIKEFFLKKALELKEILKMEYEAIAAKVIFRDPSSWGSSLWINVGEKNNLSLAKPVICKNSPVVIGNNLIGLIEFVGNSSSRVRLLTDANLVPAVRAVRGSSQDKTLLSIIQSLKNHIFPRNDLFDSDEGKELFLNTLYHLSKKLTRESEEKYFAKGELHGASQPLWRSKGCILKGIGFNYTYPDEDSILQNQLQEKNKTEVLIDPLLKVGDLLETTGMDGIFPKGLQVAIVTKIEPLTAGDFSYDIEAIPTIENLNDIQTVLVLPSIASDF